MAAVVGMASGAAAFGCAKDQAQASEAPARASVGVGEAQAASSEAGQSAYEETEFKLRIEPVGTYKAKEPGSAQIVLEAKSGFKCNDKYPYKYKLEKTEGLRFGSEVIRQESVEVSKSKSVMKLDFVPESAGKKQLEGTFYFSVCTDDKCLVERRKLSLGISVGES